MTVAKKALAAAATAAKGIRAVVLEAATVVMVLADNSGNGGAGNGCRNRGSGRATTRNKNATAVEAKTAVVVAAIVGSGVSGGSCGSSGSNGSSKTAGADHSAATMVGSDASKLLRERLHVYHNWRI